jgi:hypothetical protein
LAKRGTSKYLDIKIVLQRIKEFIFIDNGERKSDLVVCANHSQELQSNLHLDLDNRPIECYNIEMDLESRDGLEELKNLAIKEIEGSKEIRISYPARLMVLIIIH